MTAASNKISISHTDRIGLTLFLAIVLHTLIILGISFHADKGDKPDIVSTMDITLVQHKSDKAPDEADYLAQADQVGGGNTSERVKHKAPQTRPSPEQSQGQADQSVAASKATDKPSGEVQLLTQQEAERKVSSAKKTPDVSKVSKLSTQELIRRSREIARLSAENDASWQAYSKRPDSKYLHANTQRHADAAYLASWTRKVKKIGNMNYPRKNKSGNLIIEVALNPDGTLLSIQVLKSSRHKILDKAAVDIVKLAAPFAPVPPEVLQDRKVLRIVRTWVFTTDNKLHSR